MQRRPLLAACKKALPFVAESGSAFTLRYRCLHRYVQQLTYSPVTINIGGTQNVV
nr:MAG TPA: hypothetical protein [Caudoviricetes sp.]